MSQWQAPSHEDSIRAALSDRIIQDAGSVNARMNPELVSCSADGMSCTLRYPCHAGMRNPMGWMHGGVICTALDMSMGILAYHASGGHVCPTVSMNVNFLRPTQVEGYLVCRATVMHRGNKIVQLTAECWMQDRPDSITANALAGYMITGHVGAVTKLPC